MKKYILLSLITYLTMVVISHFAFDISFISWRLYKAASILFIGSILPSIIMFRGSLYKNIKSKI